MLTAQSIKILKANGWSEDRSIDLENCRKILKEKGFYTTTYYEEFLRKYGGLYIEYYNPRYMNNRIKLGIELEEAKNDAKDNINFDILDLISNNYRIDVLHERIDENNKNWIPVGQYSDGRCNLFMNENGKVYMECDEDILDEFENIEDFLNKVFAKYFAEVIE